MQAPTASPQRIGAWNELEISAVGQRYEVTLNGQKVTTYTGSRALEGHIALQILTGTVQFRNVRIKELKRPAPFTPPPAISAAGGNEPRSEVLKVQAPNAIEWVLAPLDRMVPDDIRQNLTYLREDLLDEAAQHAKAAPEAYRFGAQLCGSLLAVLEERSQAQMRAGFRAVEANARTGLTSQALDARRNYKMSWPQFKREELQRAELKGQAVSQAEVIKERPKLDWAARAAALRPTLEAQYAQYRAALRQPAQK
jgi:hypothetical protein